MDPQTDDGDATDPGSTLLFAANPDGKSIALLLCRELGAVGGGKSDILPPTLDRLSSLSPHSSGSGICTAPNGPPRNISACILSDKDSTPRCKLANVADVIGPLLAVDIATECNDGEGAGRSDVESPPPPVVASDADRTARGLEGIL
jgi:hypothetical protein